MSISKSELEYREKILKNKQLSIENFSSLIGTTEIEAEANILLATNLIPENISYEATVSSVDMSSILTSDEDDTESEISTDETIVSSLIVTPPGQTEQSMELPLEALNSLNILGSIYIESINAEELHLQETW